MFKWLDKICNRNQCTCWFDGSWSECCHQHDRGYIHNSYNETKEVIDKKFYNCLKVRTNIVNATIMYLAVKYSPIAKMYWKRYRDAK